jgi:hypothetical protein
MSQFCAPHTHETILTVLSHRKWPGLTESGLVNTAGIRGRRLAVGSQRTRPFLSDVAVKVAGSQ